MKSLCQFSRQKQHNVTMQTPTCLTKKAFLTHVQVIEAVENWRAKPADLRMLHRVYLNWQAHIPLTKDEFRAKWVRKPQASNIFFNSTYVAEVAGIYRPTLLGLSILVAHSARNTSGLMIRCAKIYLLIRKQVVQSGRGTATILFSDLAQKAGVGLEIVENAIALLADTSLGIHPHLEAADCRPFKVTAQENVLQHSSLWGYMAWQIEMTNQGSTQSWSEDVFSNQNREQYATILAVVKDGPTLLSRSLERLNNEPDAAITSARALMESTLKWIAHDAGHDPGNKSLDILFDRCMDAIGLDKDTDIGVNDLVNGINKALIGLGKLRNKRGDSHGRMPGQPSATRRHARLAVLLSIALSTYFVEAREAAK
jgi:hypothetical protein